MWYKMLKKYVHLGCWSQIINMPEILFAEARNMLLLRRQDLVSRGSVTRRELGEPSHLFLQETQHKIACVQRADFRDLGVLGLPPSLTPNPCVSPELE